MVFSDCLGYLGFEEEQCHIIIPPCLVHSIFKFSNTAIVSPAARCSVISIIWFSIKWFEFKYCEMDYDAMEDSAATATKSAIASTEPDEILDASTSSLNYLTNRKMSVTSLVNSSTFLATSSHALTSASCQDVSKLHWRLPRTGSAPSLPNRKPTLPTRDSGCVADSADYDQPRTQCAASTSSAIDVHNYQSPHIEPNNRPQTQELIEKFR